MSAMQATSSIPVRFWCNERGSGGIRLGGVLTTSPISSLARFIAESGVHPSGVQEWFTNPKGAWARYETGDLDQRQTLATLEFEAVEHGLGLDVTGFVQAFFAGFTVRETMIRVVRALKRQTSWRA